MTETSFEMVPCPSCQATTTTDIATPKSHHPQIDHTFSVVRCNSCGLHYLNPRPDPETLGYFYKLIQTEGVNLKSQSADLTSQAPDFQSKNWLKRFWYRVNYSNPLLQFINQGPVLDIGCGQGIFISELSDRGVEAHGLEFNQSAVEICLERGFEVSQGAVETSDIPKDFYKWIVLSHTLEHLLDPINALKKVKDALPEDGKVAIAVPNVNSPMVKLFGNDWHGWDPPFHLTHFDKLSLKKLCEKVGLKVIQVKIGGHPEDFTRSLALRKGVWNRSLLLRSILWIPFGFAQLLGQGSYVTTPKVLLQAGSIG